MASAVGSPQKQLSLVLQGLRDHHSPVGGVHMQGEGVLQPTQGFERKHREAGVGYRPVLLQGTEWIQACFIARDGKHPLEKDI